MSSPLRSASAGIVGFVAGIGLQMAPPVIVDGQEPANAPDGGCYVVKSGLLRGQSVCDLSAFRAADAPGEWVCSIPTDAGCDLFEFKTDGGSL